MCGISSLFFHVIENIMPLKNPLFLKSSILFFYWLWLLSRILHGVAANSNRRACHYLRNVAQTLANFGTVIGERHAGNTEEDNIKK